MVKIRVRKNAKARGKPSKNRRLVAGRDTWGPSRIATGVAGRDQCFVATRDLYRQSRRVFYFGDVKRCVYGFQPLYCVRYPFNDY